MHGHLKSEVIIGTITLVSMDEEASKFGLRVSWTTTKIQSLFGTDFVSNNEVLRRTDLFDVSYIVRKGAVTRVPEWAGMPSEWKFVVHSSTIEVHSKNSDWILCAFQIFGHILVTRRNVLLMRKTFEVHSKWRNIERYLKCIITALLQHSK